MNISDSLKKTMLLFATATLLAMPAMAETASKEAVAVVETTSSWQAPQNRVIGVLHFVEQDGKVHLTGTLEGLPPNSTHGFHIHQYGDFSKEDGTSAGGHFNPGGDPHAGPTAAHHHAGDLGNVTADENGMVKIDKEIPWLTISDGPDAILGRAVVLHAGVDDMKSQPAGAAGPRIGVGVIGWAAPAK